MQPNAATGGYRQKMFGELLARQRRNPAYSLRSYARDLGVSPATLSQLFNGKRTLSERNLKKVAIRLGFAPTETTSAIHEIKGRPDPLGDDGYTTVSDDIFRTLSDWYYFAVLSLADSGRAQATPGWIARRLNLTMFQAKDALDRLQRLGMIEIRGRKLFSTGRSFRVPSDVPSSAARRLQHDHLALARESLEKDSIDSRDMTSMTMLADPERLPEAKRMIKHFRRRLTRYLEQGKRERVYVLAVQLFPVSQGGLS